MVDTGFTGFLTVTPSLALEPRLPFEGTARATLADDGETTFPYYGVAVLWDGQTRYVEADAADTTPLVGMRLLEGHSLYVEVGDGRRVVIRAHDYRLNKTSKMVLSTVKLGPPNWTNQEPLS
ncbi:MAG: clan AA aspartic protease [Chloroflexi bacterium]|nr:clan AA aspartic protease [Chloroflexota bacterium]